MEYRTSLLLFIYCCSLSKSTIQFIQKFKVAYEYFLKAQADQIFRETEWSKYKALLKGLGDNTDNIPDLIVEFSKAEVDLESCNTFMTRIF